MASLLWIYIWFRILFGAIVKDNGATLVKVRWNWIQLTVFDLIKWLNIDNSSADKRERKKNWKQEFNLFYYRREKWHSKVKYEGKRSI